MLLMLGGLLQATSVNAFLPSDAMVVMTCGYSISHDSRFRLNVYPKVLMALALWLFMKCSTGSLWLSLVPDCNQLSVPIIRNSLTVLRSSRDLRSWSSVTFCKLLESISGWCCSDGCYVKFDSSVDSIYEFCLLIILSISLSWFSWKRRWLICNCIVWTCMLSLWWHSVWLSNRWKWIF